jgi:type III pantothenate kinase
MFRYLCSISLSSKYIIISLHLLGLIYGLYSMIWLALAIGNSRFHWAWFIGQELQELWHSDYVSADSWQQQLVLPDNFAAYLKFQQRQLSDIPIYLASVVPAQTKLWQPYVQRAFTLADVPLLNLYPTLGIDRALAAYGAGQHYGYPVLVIDGGTALTLTGIDGNRSLVGGAICPGLGLQLQSLSNGTAALPKSPLPATVTPRWAQDTPSAMMSGVLHISIVGLQGFIQDWQQRFSHSPVLVTGGDGELLHYYLQHLYEASPLGESLPTIFSESLVLQGIAQLL